MDALVNAPPRHLLAALLALAACASEPPCNLRLCDIREPRCQREVASATACLRGQAPAPVPTRVLSQERFLAESVAAGDGNVDTALFTRWMAGLALFDLASTDVSVAEASREQAAWVAAFYDPADRSVTIIDRGEPLDSGEAIALLVHEYTHALQDRTVGLDVFRARLPADFDRLLASKAVSEGEATLIEDLAALGLFGAPETDVRWPDVFAWWQQLAREWAVETKLPVDMSIGLFPYPFGLPYVHAVYRQGGFAAIDGLYASPPVSAAQVLAGFGAPAPAEGWAEDLGEDSVPALPTRYVYVDSDRLGGWILDVFLERLEKHRALVRSPALAGLGSRLRADRLSIFRDVETDRTSACWRLRLPSGELAQQLAGALTAGGPWRAWARNRDVILLGSPDRTLLDSGPLLSFGPVPAAPPAMPSATAGRYRGCPRRPEPGPRGNVP
jgi:hypothetical protein